MVVALEIMEETNRRTAPVGADAHIRPTAARPLRGRVDEGIDPYAPHP